MFGRRTSHAEPPVQSVAKKVEWKQVNSIVGENATFEGDVRVDGSLRVDGELRGSVDVTGHVHVGPGGLVEGGITAREVVVSGRIVGRVKAAEMLRVLQGARLNGDVETRRLSVEDGATFDGSCVMNQSDAHAGSAKGDDAATETGTFEVVEAPKPDQRIRG